MAVLSNTFASFSKTIDLMGENAIMELCSGIIIILKSWILAV